MVTPPDETPADVTPETRATLAALQRSTALERRASKRFSSYTFNKMGIPGSPGKDSANSPQRPTRRADRAPPMPTLPEGLGTLRNEESDEEAAQNVSALLGPPQIITHGVELESSTRSEMNNRKRTPEPEDINQQATPRPSDHQRRSQSHSQIQQSPPTSIRVFLQIGKQVKKVTVDLPMTLSALKLLFMERFEYDPGMEDFPDVYLRDNRTGVQFELEEMDDLRDGCVLSLNIERESSGPLPPPSSDSD